VKCSVPCLCSGAVDRERLLGTLEARMSDSRLRDSRLRGAAVSPIRDMIVWSGNDMQVVMSWFLRQRAEGGEDHAKFLCLLLHSGDGSIVGAGKMRERCRCAPEKEGGSFDALC